uniref:Carboxypeptidase Z n=1 Tax=Eptatretus burgeri TaxID=7764 RepID=A0A8C4R1J0_EPTBU
GQTATRLLIGRIRSGRVAFLIRILLGKAEFCTRGSALEPEVRLVANIHGNEVLGRELLVTLAQHLCAMHRRGDSRVSSLLERTRVHIVPSLNPDGYQFATESMERELFSGRMNMQNMDLNRNFPDLTNIVLRMKAPKRHWGPVPIPDEYWSDEVAPETRAVMRWSSSIPFVISANLHGGDLLIRYPYDLSLTGEEESSPSPDEEVFLHLASTYADAHKIIANNGTESCPLGMSAAGGVGSGAQVYNLHGGMQDFSYLHHGCFEITVELGCKKFPNASELEQEWENNREALFSFLESVHQGIKGVVRNENGRGIRGIHIAVKGNPRDVVTTRSGEYWRLLQPGTYLVQASGPGYLPSLKRVYIPEGMRHAGQVNFKLQPDPRPRRITLQRWKQRRWMAKHASGRRHGGDQLNTRHGYPSDCSGGKEKEIRSWLIKVEVVVRLLK